MLQWDVVRSCVFGHLSGNVNAVCLVCVKELEMFSGLHVNINVVDKVVTVDRALFGCTMMCQVPLTVSNLDFWSRYYFRCHELDKEEARRVELMRRADEVQGEKEIGWDEGCSRLMCDIGCLSVCLSLSLSIT